MTNHALMAFEADQRAHRHAEFFRSCRRRRDPANPTMKQAARTSRQAALEFHCCSTVPAVAMRSSTRKHVALDQRVLGISISSMPYSSE